MVANRDEIVTLVLEASRNGMARVSKPAIGVAPVPAAPRAGQITHPVDAGEPMAPQASGLGEKAIIMPAEQQVQGRPQKQEAQTRRAPRSCRAVHASCPPDAAPAGVGTARPHGASAVSREPTSRKAQGPGASHDACV